MPQLRFGEPEVGKPKVEMGGKLHEYGLQLMTNENYKIETYKT